jgi:hypothetical protein
MLRDSKGKLHKTVATGSLILALETGCAEEANGKEGLVPTATPPAITEVINTPALTSTPEVTSTPEATAPQVAPETPGSVEGVREIFSVEQNHEK